jgi:hypothetical protein
VVQCSVFALPRTGLCVMMPSFAKHAKHIHPLSRRSSLVSLEEGERRSLSNIRGPVTGLSVKSLTIAIRLGGVAVDTVSHVTVTGLAADDDSVGCSVVFVAVALPLPFSFAECYFWTHLY